MKKNLFYAAFAIAMMASCTNEDNLVVDPVEPTPEDKVALNLGVVAPSVNATVGARGTGAVGDVAGTNNVWNSQQLYIAMIDRETGDLAKDVETNDTIMGWSTYTYRAPRKEQGVTDSIGNIRIYQNTAVPTTPAGNGTIQYLYYPTQGTFDFYGWHLDDAGGSPAITKTAATATTASTTSIAITGITINGTQDIMGAKTKPFTSTDNYANYTTELAPWAFSARTARNEIDPILKFEHQLARVKFFVKAGSQSAAIYDNATPTSPKAGLDDANAATTSAMYVTGISIPNLHTTLSMTLDNTTIATTAGTEVDTFKLGSLINGIVGDSLTPVAPYYHKDYTGTKAQDVTTNEAQVGESIMFLPVSATDGKGTDKQIEILLNLKQRVQLTEVEGTTDKTFGFKTQSSKVTVLAEHVKNGNSTVTAFEPGKSYNVYITIYGFERIEISAELTPWKDGGDVDVDIEEGTSKGDQSQTPTTYDITFNVTDGNNAIADPVITVSSPAEATVSGTTITVPAGTQSITYSVTASGYDPITNATATVDATTNNTVNVTMSAQAPTTEKVTVTINATPADATVTINGQTVSTLEVEKGTDVTWSVAKEGYTTQEGTYTAIAEDKTETITLVGEDRTVTFSVLGYKADTTPTITVNEVALEGTTTIAKVGDVISWKVTGTKEDDSATEKTGTFTVVAEANNNTITVNLAQ